MASPLVEQFRKGGISKDVRLTAASGVLPLKPVDQVELLYLLGRDSEQQVREKAEASLLGISSEDRERVLSDRSTDSGVLDFFATRLDSKNELKSIIQNPSTKDTTLQALASRLSSDLIELIVINQTRLLRHPPIIDSLETNPSLNSDQRRRLAELKHDFKLGEKREAPSPAAVLMDLGAGPPEQEEAAPVSVEEALVLYNDGQGEEGLTEEQKQERITLLQRVLRMTAAEKMIEGLKGERESRMLLIRDRNRVVYSAVLDSPKLTETEVEAFAAMKNVSPEVLRTIGGKREWTKRYSVAHELVRNPLTPIEISMQLIGRLAPRDLKRLATDRNVPEAVRRQATKLSGPQR